MTVLYGIGMILKGKRKLLNDEERKNLKHREMYLYDRWLLNHNYIPFRLQIYI